jgi:hypothetical protein
MLLSRFLIPHLRPRASRERRRGSQGGVLARVRRILSTWMSVDYTGGLETGRQRPLPAVIRWRFLSATVQRIPRYYHAAINRCAVR